MNNVDRVKKIIGEIQYLNWDLVLETITDRYDNVFLYLHVEFDAPDIQTGNIGRQYCREWIIYEISSETEIVETAWKAIEAAVLHEAKENFKYKGRPIYNPHMSVDARFENCLNT